MPEAAKLEPTPAEIEEALRRIGDAAWRTPTVPAGRDEDDILLKLECIQRTGSFKIRGAWNRMSRTTADERTAGFVTISAGNHGQAVAWCARRLGARCTVWVPDNAVARKVEAMEASGAKVQRMPHDAIMQAMVDDAFARDHPVFVHPFADRMIIAGQGTVGLEILDDVPEVRTVLVPVGGGGLATGVATAIKAARPEAKVFGVQAAAAAPYAKAWTTGRPERVGTPDTIADGIAASVAFPYMLPLLRRRLDGVLTVEDEDMRRAVRDMAAESHAVAEPAGAASLAAARVHADALEPPVVCVVSGGNINPALLAEIVGSAKKDRSTVRGARTAPGAA